MTDGPTVVELEFAFDGGDFFLVEASDQAECEFELEMVLPRSDDAVIEYFSVRGADPDRILDLLDRARDVREARSLDRTDDGGLFEIVTDGHLAKALADTGTPVTGITATAGEGRLTADVPPHVDVGAAVRGFLDENPTAELVARRETDRRAPGFATQQLATELLAGLTPKQLRALRVAHANGYFEWPRDVRAADVADRLGVSNPTFTQHLRAAERKVFDSLFG